MRTIDEIMSSEQPRPVIVAHRGASHYFPENTMEAFEAAVDMQAEMMEFDVRRTADGVLVVHHDFDFAGHEIKAISKDQLEDLEKESNYKVPTLQETLEFCVGKIPVDVELKEAGYEEQVLEEITDIMEPDHYIITSFLESVIRRVKDLKPEIRTGWVLSGRPRHQLLKKLYPERKAREAGADLLVVSRELLKVGFLSTTRNLGLPVWIYTVNDRKELWKMITDDRVAGIFTDRPDVALFLRDLYAVGKSKDMPPSITVPE